MDVSIALDLEEGVPARISLFAHVNTLSRSAGVEFTGWGDPVTGKYFGFGVRWLSLPWAHSFPPCSSN
jgi:hypothetical protein